MLRGGISSFNGRECWRLLSLRCDPNGQSKRSSTCSSLSIKEPASSAESLDFMPKAPNVFDHVNMLTIINLVL